MVAGRCRFHSGCGSRRIGSSTEPTTRRTAAWFASRLRLASFVSCVRPRVNSSQCGLISFASPSATIFKTLLGRGRCSASHGASRHALLLLGGAGYAQRFKSSSHLAWAALSAGESVLAPGPGHSPPDRALVFRSEVLLDQCVMDDKSQGPSNNRGGLVGGSDAGTYRP